MAGLNYQVLHWILKLIYNALMTQKASRYSPCEHREECCTVFSWMRYKEDKVISEHVLIGNVEGLLGI